MTHFIFFEIAAKFEDFSKLMFQAEVRSVYGVTVAQSPFIMGDSDNGLDFKLGWGSPQKLRERGMNLLGADSFFGSLDTKLGTATYSDLIAAHTVRNRIAHPGGKAERAFVKLLTGAGIPTAERMGMSVGRFLRDYPSVALPVNRNFFVYLDAYAALATNAKVALP
ncbi:MAG: hypothetical protein IPP07_15070 [Holophagales bacterium]|nr:hypothetical protein [Holophagales bacterium]